MRLSGGFHLHLPDGLSVSEITQVVIATLRERERIRQERANRRDLRRRVEERREP